MPSRLVSLGPDCGLKHRMEEHALPWNKSGPSELFDWVLSTLPAVVAVLEAVDPERFFDAAQWSLFGVSPSGSYDFVHEPSGLRSLHDARVAEYESVEAARAAVADRYVRRLQRLREQLDAPGSLRFVHVVDNENEMNFQPPPSREVIRRVRKLLPTRHRLVIVHDGDFSASAGLAIAGVAHIDTRRFRQHEEPGRAGEPAEPAGWRRAHLDWEELLLAVSVAQPASVDSKPDLACALLERAHSTRRPGIDVEVAFTAGGVALSIHVLPLDGAVPLVAATVAPDVAETVTATGAALEEAGLMRCEFEVLPLAGDVSMEDVYRAAVAVTLPGVSWLGWRAEPLFFGLEKLIVIMRLADDEGGTSAEDVLAHLGSFEGAQSARLLSATSGADAFTTCSRLFSVQTGRICELALPCLGAEAAEALMSHGWATVDDWMTREAIDSISSIAAASMAARSDGVSDGVAWRTPEPRHARKDVATWLNVAERPASDDVFAKQLLPRFEALAGELRTLMAGIGGRLEIQLACFPANLHARYRRHVDASADGRPASAERKVTCILYCNPAWVEASAGCLRLTRTDHEKGTAGACVDIQPIGGRLLCFLSGAMMHEVMPTQADRFAVTAWVT